MRDGERERRGHGEKIKDEGTRHEVRDPRPGEKMSLFIRSSNLFSSLNNQHEVLL